MKNTVLMLCLSLFLGFSAWAHAPDLEDYRSSKIYQETEVEFWFNGSFPLDRHFCIPYKSKRECTPGGLLKHQIALTFDDGPNENTPKILNILRRNNIPATFFLTVGPSLSESRKKILDQMFSDGHKISSHGANHGLLAKAVSDSAVIKSLMDTHKIIAPYQRHGDITLYRNPGGFWSRKRAQALNAHPVLSQYVGPIFWNVGGDNVFDKKGRIIEAADWRCRQRRLTAEACAVGYYNKIISNHRNNVGSLVLMHDIHAITTATLENLIRYLKQDGVDWEFIFVQDIPSVNHNALSI